MKVLVTGFESFSGFKSNPTEFIAKTLDGEKLGELLISGEVWPVAFSKIDDLLEAALKKDFDVIIHLGLAFNRSVITPERVALNIMDCPGREDNEGKFFNDEPIDPDAADGLFSTLPIKKMAFEMKGEVSNTAGTYVCNYTMFKSLQMINKIGLKVRSGFIHIPAHKELKSESSYSLNDLLSLIRCGLYQLQT